MKQEIHSFLDTLTRSERDNVAAELLDVIKEIGRRSAMPELPRKRSRRASPKCQRKPNWDARFKKP